MQAGSSTEKHLLYEPKHYFETLMISVPMVVLLSLLTGALAVRCPILTSVSQLGAVRRSGVTIPAAVKAHSMSMKENTQSRKKGSDEENGINPTVM